jgi:DNA invertase Pin-like site-specific DNA recombinase
MTHFVYGYGQASFDPTVLSTENQEIFLRNACAALINAGRFPADSAWCGFVRDDATRKPVRFRQRPAASMFLAELGPSHILMAASSDRVFANVVDACETLELANQIGFRLLTLDYGIDTGAPHELLLPIAATMKHLRQRERRRTKEEFEYRKRQGIPAGGKCPIGWEIVRADLDGNDNAYFVPDNEARRVAHFIAEHYDRWGGNFEQTAYWMNAQKILRPDGRRWRKSAIRNWYHPAKNGFPLPNGRREAYPIPVGARPCVQSRRVELDD